MTRATTDHAYAPRGLRLADAARWIGLGQTKFLELVNAGRLPKARRIDGAVVWDRYELDAAFDAIGESDEGDDGKNPWDEVA